MSSGVECDDDVANIYKEFKMMGKSSVKKRAIMFKFNEDFTRIIHDKNEDFITLMGTTPDMTHTAEYHAFLSKLPVNDCRYIIYDVEGQRNDGCPTSGISLLCWVPEQTSVRKKMVFASSKDALKNKLQGIKLKVHVESLDDNGWDEMQDRLKKC
uniref:Cofilin-2 n=1 Tax=Salmo salar TaxID=8030 RepID=B5XDP5_SALSA|nr:Cofilin-2 [Salmo salar]